MGLAEQQAFLARLYTDGALREAFFAAPREVGEQWQLSAEEAEGLACLSARQVGQFAHSLHSKRLGEVRHLLPATHAALGTQFPPLFRRYAATYVPQGNFKHREDALRFVAFLTKEKPPLELWLVDVARYEAAWLTMRAGRSLYVRRFCYRVSALVNALSRGELIEAPSRRPCVGLWLRPSPHSPIRCIVLPLPF